MLLFQPLSDASVNGTYPSKGIPVMVVAWAQLSSPSITACATQQAHLRAEREFSSTNCRSALNFSQNHLCFSKEQTFFTELFTPLVYLSQKNLHTSQRIRYTPGMPPRSGFQVQLSALWPP